MSGSCAIYVPENDLFFTIFYALAICHFAWPWKTGPFFLSFPKETWHLVGSVFRGEPKWKICTALVSPHFFSQHQAAFLGHRWRNSHSFAKIRLGMPTYMAQLPHISRHPSVNQPNQNMPHRSELSQDRRQLRHLCPKKDNSDVFPGGFASCLGITLMSFLVVLPSALG